MKTGTEGSNPSLSASLPECDRLTSEECMQDKNTVLIDRLAWAVLAICVYAFLLGNEVF